MTTPSSSGSSSDFALDQVQASIIFLYLANFVFRCPATGLNVQHETDDDADISENEYEAITYLACTGLHLVNRKTGKLLGQDDE